MKLLTDPEVQDILDQLRESASTHENEVFDVYLREWKPLSYYSTNTRGVFVHAPSFTQASILSDQQSEAIMDAIREANLLDELVTEFTHTAFWKEDPNKPMSTVALRMVWLYQDNLADTLNYNVERLMRNSGGYMLAVMQVITGNDKPYQARPWIAV